MSVRNKLITVYRVEDKNGIGPYRYDNYDIIDHHNFDNENHPTIYIDKKLSKKNISKYIKFGFINWSQMKRWFTNDELKQLKCRGFNIVKYKVKRKHIYIGDKQIVFKGVK